MGDSSLEKTAISADNSADISSLIIIKGVGKVFTVQYLIVQMRPC